MFTVTKHQVSDGCVRLVLLPKGVPDIDGKGAEIVIDLVKDDRACSISERDDICIKDGKVLWTPRDVEGEIYGPENIECAKYTA